METDLRVVIATDGFLEPETTPAGPYDPVFVPHDDVPALLAALDGSAALVTRRVNVDRALLAGARSLRLVQQVGIGTDRIDLECARQMDIAVANTPGATSNAVVEHCFMLTLASLRNLVDQADAMRRGGWSGASVWEGEEIAGKTVGIIGYGSIGSDLARRFLAFGARVVVGTRTVPDSRPDGIGFVSLPALLAQSDIVVVAAGLNASTRGMIGRAELASMKEGALLVNIARGAIVDEEALVEALASGRIRAALDAYTVEPLPAGASLRAMPEAVLTPHSAGSSRQSRDRIWRQMSDNLARLASGRALENIVNGVELKPLEEFKPLKSES